mgnify:CR=1 FL=1
MQFKYQAKASNGKTMKGVKDADNEAEVISWIRDNGWIPINISRSHEVAIQIGESVAPKNTDWSDFFDLSRKIKLKDKSIFFRQLSTMISAGIPIASAIEILSEQTSSKRLKKIIKNLYTRVSSGGTLGRALEEYPKTFDSLTVSLVRSGEESGTLDDSLSKLADFLEEQDALRKKIVSALTYPGVVMSIALIVLGIMVAVVIPQFQRAFSNLNVKMPMITQKTFEFGTWARKNWYTIPLAFFIIFLLAHFLRKVKSLKIYIDSAMLKLPIFGDIVFKAALSRSFRTMSSLLRSGVPVLTALEMAGNVSANEKLRLSFVQMRDAAAMGGAMNTVMREKKLFPPMIIHMIAVGEETGRTDDMMEKVADWYESELSEKIKRLSSVLEPVMIVFVGVIVAFMVLAIFLPIVTSIQALI